MNILYITVHLGGGVGKAILGVVKETKDDFKSTIIMLEQPEKEGVVQASIQDGIDIHICPSVDEIRRILIDTDIVVLNWWNHPLMASFLYEFPQIPCRMIIWSHINGCTYPYLPFDFLEVFDKIWFTSSFSYDNTYWIDEQRKYIQNNSEVILGNGDFEPQDMPIKKSYEIKDNFRVGYVGTLGYSKMNKDYVRYCEKASEKCPDIEFVLVGEPDKELLEDIKNSRYANSFICTGYMKDVEKVFLSFDVLGYILNDDNYGTTENVILEAMAYGIPVIALNGGVERQIIDDKKNGYLVSNEEEYAECIELIYRDDILKEKLGRSARQKVCDKFASKDNLERIKREFEKIILFDKHTFHFDKILGDTPYEWFLKFTGEDREVFQQIVNNTENMNIYDKFRKLIDKKNIYVGKRKSSIHHYFSYYREDNKLKKLVDYCTKGRNK